MNHWLCLNPRVDCKPEELARFLDEIPLPWEWQDQSNVHEGGKLIVVRADSMEHLASLLQTIPDRRIVTAFGFSQVKES